MNMEPAGSGECDMWMQWNVDAVDAWNYRYRPLGCISVFLAVEIGGKVKEGLLQK